MIIACPSRGRPGNVPNIQKLFPDCTFYVSKTEAPFYKQNGAKKIVEHPDDITGVGKKKQWLLDSTPEDMFIVDDDIKYVWVNVGRLGRRIEEPDAIRQIIENAFQCATDMGAGFLGFANSWDVRKYTPNDPFNFTGWVGAAMGFIGRDIPYDQGFNLRNDVSCSLHNLLVKRYIWKDTRFAFVCERNTNFGGLSLDRTKESDLANIQRMVDRWGKYLVFKEIGTTMNVSVRVPRRQPLPFEDLLRHKK